MRLIIIFIYFFSFIANSHDYKKDNIIIERPILKVNSKDANVGAGYFKIINNSKIKEETYIYWGDEPIGKLKKGNSIYKPLAEALNSEYVSSEKKLLISAKLQKWLDNEINDTITNLPAGNYNVVVTDRNSSNDLMGNPKQNGCYYSENFTLTEPDEFSKGTLYVVNASCYLETDGQILVRTSGGVPPLIYTYNSSEELVTSEQGLVVFEEGSNIDQAYITESDILVSNLRADSENIIRIVSDQNGCVDEIADHQPTPFVKIGSNDTECIFIPSVFTPNGDGINDTWQIDGIDLYINPTIQVFNRWGQLIFESIEGPYVPWDGIGQIEIENQEIATYYYVIDLNIDNKKYNGSVTIKR